MAVALAAVAGCTLRPAAVEGPAARTVEARLYRVERVIDGDTLVVTYDEQRTSVRLPAIDAPERGHPGATAATAALREFVDGRTVRLEFTEPTKRDRYGRLLARVWVRGADGEEIDAGAELLRRGLVRRWIPNR